MGKSGGIRAERLERLREEMRRLGVNGFIVPHNDSYRVREPPPCSARLEWLTGFTGSAGVCVALEDRAVVLTDGRYAIQVRRQVDGGLYATGDSTLTPPEAWLAENVKRGAVVGYDPWLHTPAQTKAMRERLEPLGIVLEALKDNPVDRIWTEDRPHQPMEPVWAWSERYAGRSARDKIEVAAKEIEAKGAVAAVLASPESISWVLNVRSRDVPQVPAALSFAILRTDPLELDWFIDPERIEPALFEKLGNRVRIIGPHALEHELEQVAELARKAGRPVMLDGRRAPEWFRMYLERAGAGVLDAPDPCVAPRAIKTPEEQAAMADAHRRDGLSLIRFFAWLDGQVVDGARLDEIGVAERLEEFRRADPLYRGPSFDTICGFGPNGAIIHYHASAQSNLRIVPPGILLLDSGGQYECGTTDVTRTLAIGAPGEDVRGHYTLVLKAHIAVALAVFPDGTPGAQVDALARRVLWEHNLDYGHGTGHGVGCFLSVHEEAASFSPRSLEKVHAGMIISDEPGYYREDHYGIRIENLVLVEETGAMCSTGPAMLRFRPLTMAPYDRRLIDAGALSPQERNWVNAYHQSLWQLYREELDSDAAGWLRQATALL